MRRTFWLWATIAAIGLGGCFRPPKVTGSVYERLQHPDPGVRADAAVEAGRDGDRQAVPLLIDRLTDSAPDVRLLAAVSLRKITRQDFGWRAWGSHEEQQKAVARWRQWQTEQVAAQDASPSTGSP